MTIEKLPHWNIQQMRVVQQKPPLWGRILTLGIWRYYKGWKVQGTLALNHQAWYFESPPATEPPNPGDVANAVALAINDKLADIEHYFNEVDMIENADLSELAHDPE